MTKGRQGKRDGPKATGVAFCGASQPRSFLSKGVFVKMAKAGDGLYETILMAAPMPNLLPPREVQAFIEQLEETGVKELLRVCLTVYLLNIKVEKPGCTNCQTEQKPPTTNTAAK